MSESTLSLDLEQPSAQPLSDEPLTIRGAVAKLSDRGIQRIVGGNAYLRGRIYARRNAVVEIVVDEPANEITAKVLARSEEPFEVRLQREQDGAFLSACNCTGWRGPRGHCKHVAAVLVAVRDKERPPRATNGANANGASAQEARSSNGANAHGGASNSALNALGLATVSVGGKRRRTRRRRRGATGDLPVGVDVVTGRELGYGQQGGGDARGSLEAWLPADDVVRAPELEFRLMIRPASVAITAIIAGTRTAVPVADLLAAGSAISGSIRPLLRTLSRFALRSQPATAELRGEDAAEVLSMFTGRRVLLEPASMELRFSDEPLKPKLELEPSGIDNVRVRVVFETKTTHRRFLLSHGAWFEGSPSWHIDTTDGIARKIVDSVSPAWLTRLYRSPTLLYPVADLPRLLTELIPRVATSLGADLPDLSSVADLVDAAPRFILQAGGDLIDARLKLQVSYDDLVMDVPSSGFPSPLAVEPASRDDNDDDDVRPRVIRRDIGAEMAAVQQLMNLGFKPDDLGQVLLAQGDTAIAFWTDGVATLPETWEKYIPHDLAAVNIRNTPVTPKMRISSGVDWLSVDMTFDAGGVAVSEDELRMCLAQGRRLVKLADGSYAPVESKQVGEILERMAEIVASGSSPTKLPLSQAGRVQDLMRMVATQNVSSETKELFGKLDEIGTIEQVAKPRSLKAELRPYQRQGFSWLVFLHGLGTGGILADDMGLGKTLQTIALLLWAKSKAKNTTTLVVAPTSVVPNWAREIEKFAPTLKTLLWHGVDRHDQKESIGDADVVITSYALLRRDEEMLSSIGFNYVILDEAQHIKNPLSATARAAKKLQCQRRLALTGTPIENRLSEIWSIFDFVAPGLLGNLQSFEEKYARPIDRGDDEAKKRLRTAIHPFVMRRTKSEVAKDLPEKIEQEIIVPLADEQSKLYKQILRQVRENIMSEIEAQGVGKSQIQILAALTRLRQVACDPRLLKLSGEFDNEESGKLNALREIVSEAVAGGHKVLIFSQFVEMLKLIRELFEREGFTYEYLDGSTKDRQARVDHFNTDESVSAFLISLKAGGTGLNLTGADTVIHFDPWWNPAVEDQATDRAHRIGQTKVVTVYRLIARGTVEEKILQLSGKKRALMTEVLSAEGSAVPKGLSRDDVTDLFAD